MGIQFILMSFLFCDTVEEKCGKSAGKVEGRGDFFSVNFRFFQNFLVDL